MVRTPTVPLLFSCNAAHQNDFSARSDAVYVRSSFSQCRVLRRPGPSQWKTQIASLFWFSRANESFGWAASRDRQLARKSRTPASGCCIAGSGLSDC